MTQDLIHREKRKAIIVIMWISQENYLIFSQVCICKIPESFEVHSKIIFEILEAIKNSPSPIKEGKYLQLNLKTKW